jgi:hypothetical protein
VDQFLHEFLKQMAQDQDGRILISLALAALGTCIINHFWSWFREEP